MFKLVRMDNLEKTNIKFTKSHNLSDIKMKDNNDNIVHIKLYGKAVIKAKCREYLNGRITQEFENGDFEFSFSVPEHETFWYGVILSFGNKTKIIEPQEIKERIIKTAKKYKWNMGNKDEIISERRSKTYAVPISQFGRCGIIYAGKKGVEKIMQRIHSIQYDPLNVVARNADLVLAGKGERLQ